MSATIPRLPLIFRWSVQDGFGASGKLIARSFRSELEGTSSRTSPKWMQDRNGLYAPVNRGVESVGYVNGVLALLREAAATNIAWHCRDLTQAAWVKSSTTAAKTQTGIDGVASSASLLTATAGNGTCLQTVTLASSVRRQTAFVKRVTGSGTIQMTTDNGATWTTVTVTSAWTRAKIPAQTVTNPVFGFRIVTSGDAIAVDFVDNVSGADESSPILTAGAAVTRAADSLSFGFLTKPQAKSIYVRGIALQDATAAPSATQFLMAIGDTVDPIFAIFRQSGSALDRCTYVADGGAFAPVSTLAGATVAGDVVEYRGYLPSDGAVVLGRSINAGTESVGSAGTSGTLDSSYQVEQIHIGSRNAGSLPMNFAFQQVVVAFGSKTLPELRALAEAA